MYSVDLGFFEKKKKRSIEDTDSGGQDYREFIFLLETFCWFIQL